MTALPATRTVCHSVVFITSHHVTSRHVTSRHVTSHHVTSRHVTSRHVLSCRTLYALSPHATQQACVGFINPLTPNDTYSGRTAPLTSKVAFYIFIQQIQVLNILNMVYTLRFYFLPIFTAASSYITSLLALLRQSSTTYCFLIRFPKTLPRNGYNTAENTITYQYNVFILHKILNLHF